MISKKKRFTVLCRDNYTCQYCGRKAPLVQLEIDHKTPKSKGGSDSIENLITACFDCNRGKGKDVVLEMYKIKVEDRKTELKKYFYNDWNNRRLGSIDGLTMRLLAIYINNCFSYNDICAYLNCRESFALVGKRPSFLITKEDWVKIEEEFKKGGKFCDKILKIIVDETKENIDIILKDVEDDDYREYPEQINKTQRLNNEITKVFYGDFYLIKKFTLFPNSYQNE